MKLIELIKAVKGCRIVSGKSDIDICGLSSDSREVSPGYVFFAIKGSNTDGNKFISEAVDRGAVAVFTDARNLNIKGVTVIELDNIRKSLAEIAGRYYGNPSCVLKVVGITGTNGKTTVAYLIESIIRAAGRNAGVIGTVNYRFADKIIAAKNTTPGPLELQGLLSDMLEAGCSYAVSEVSSHALDQERVEGISFHSAVFTNLTQDHLDYHKTMEEYFKSKSKLFKGLKDSSCAVINTDDEYGLKLKSLSGGKVTAYGINRPAAVMAKDIEFSFTHTSFKISYAKSAVTVKSPLIGRHNVYNILAAFAWAVEEGIDVAVIRKAVEDFGCVPGRLERIDSGRGFSVFVDYAHTEDALKNVITALRELKPNRIIVVFGCGGDRDRGKRPKMGEVVTAMADYAVITSDNPRSEDPDAIIKEIESGVLGSNYTVISDRLSAIRHGLSMAGEGDAVLVAGKGHEDYQIIGDKRIHFDDKEAVRDCLKSMS